jgi:acetyl-CoA carboxylase carboxyltransferase component
MDSGTENLDWTARVLKRIIELSAAGHEINVIVCGVNVGAQSYWNAEATMLMEGRGMLVMVGDSAMVLTGKRALDYSGGVSADNETGIGGYDRIMGPNGEAQHWAPSIEAACRLLFRHYDVCYAAPAEGRARCRASEDSDDRDICLSPHRLFEGSGFTTVGEIFDDRANADRKKPFDIRSVMKAVVDRDDVPLERWEHWAEAEASVVWDAHIGGYPVRLLGFESYDLTRHGPAAPDGPDRWTAGTLFPQGSKKAAKAIRRASANRPLVILANLSGFDGSPESMRRLQLECGAEIGRAIVEFKGPILFCLLSRYHGGAFVVFSKALNSEMEVIAVRGAKASVLGGAPAAAVVFASEIEKIVRDDPAIARLRSRAAKAEGDGKPGADADLAAAIERKRLELQTEWAARYDRIHDIERALEQGSIDRIIDPTRLRPEIIETIRRKYNDIAIS